MRKWVGRKKGGWWVDLRRPLCVVGDASLVCCVGVAAVRCVVCEYWVASGG